MCGIYMINKGNGGKSFNKLKEEFLLNQNALQKHANTLKSTAKH